MECRRGQRVFRNRTTARLLLQVGAKGEVARQRAGGLKTWGWGWGWAMQRVRVGMSTKSTAPCVHAIP